MQIELSISADVKSTPRIKQLSSSFQVPVGEKLSRDWSIDFPIEERDWNVGLIVGPSGSGKSQVARKIYGADKVDSPLDWARGAVVDDFDRELSIKDITAVCSAVGFNTVPSWMRPFATLSNGEQFRVELARRLLEAAQDDTIVVDEFSSVVDRQVAKIASHSVQKYIRRHKKKFVAVTCHYDVVDWLQPDWVLEPSTCSFRWRSLRRRPEVECELREVGTETWKKFAPYHYLTDNLHRAARCYGLFVNGEHVAFAGMLPRPVSSGKGRGSVVWGFSRVVVLPDWQGLGLAFVIMQQISSAYAACGYRTRTYPAHPSFVRSFSRLDDWKQITAYGRFRKRNTGTSTKLQKGGLGGRNSAVFEYVGKGMEDKFTAMKIARMIK